MPKNIKFILLLLLMTGNLMAQNARYSLDIHGGLPYGVMSIPGDFKSWSAGAGLRYSYRPALSFELVYDQGNITGSQTVKTFTGKDLPENYLSYSNDFKSIVLNAQLNLTELFHLRAKLKRINLYFVLGAGELFSDNEAYRVDGIRKHFTFATNQGNAGLIARYYLGSAFDFSLSFTHTLSQSPFVDAIHRDQTYDAYWMGGMGIAYKIGARKSVPHTDWLNVIVKEKVYKPSKRKLRKQQREEERIKAMIAKSQLQLNTQQPVASASTPGAVDSESIEVIDLKSNADNLTNARKDTITTAKPEIAEAPKKDSIAELPLPPKDSVVVTNDAPKPPTLPISKADTVPDIIDIPPATEAVKEPEVQLGSAPAQQYRPSGGIVTPDLPVTAPAVVPAVAGLGAGALKPSLPVKLNKSSTSPKKPAVKEVPVTRPVREPEVAEIEIAKIPEIKTAPKAKPEITEPNAVEAPADRSVTMPPIARYNIIVGAFASNRYAHRFRRALERKGYEAYVFRSRPGSRLLRVSIHSGNTLSDARAQLRKIRRDVEPQAWIHVFNR